MAEVPDYVGELLRRQAALTDLTGVYSFGVTRELYVINMETLILLAVVMKALNDNGIVLDAEWQDRLDHALDGTWPDWIVAQRNPDLPPQ